MKLKKYTIRLFLGLSALTGIIETPQIAAGSGKYWGIGLGAGLGGFLLGRATAPRDRYYNGGYYPRQRVVVERSYYPDEVEYVGDPRVVEYVPTKRKKAPVYQTVTTQAVTTQPEIDQQQQIEELQTQLRESQQKIKKLEKKQKQQQVKVAAPLPQTTPP